MGFRSGLKRFRSITTRSKEAHTCANCGREIKPGDEHKFDSSPAMHGGNPRRFHVECPKPTA